MFDVRSVICAKTVDEAIRALCADENAMIVSGGTDVLVQNREGRRAGATLVSVHDIKDLKGVRMDESGNLIIGAGTCFTDVTNDPLIQKYAPMLGAAVDQVGGPQIRNVGTIGGNVCNGVTSADSAPSLMALDAELVLRGKDGVRATKLRDFYVGAGKTTRAHDEVLCEIRIPKVSYENAFGCYIKYGKRNTMEISTLGCAALVRLSSDKKRFERAAIAFGVAAPTPIRCDEAEKALLELPVSAQSVERAARLAVGGVSPRTSWRASKEFRLHLVRELCIRALSEAIQLAGGTME